MRWIYSPSVIFTTMVWDRLGHIPTVPSELPIKWGACIPQSDFDYHGVWQACSHTDSPVGDTNKMRCRYSEGRGEFLENSHYHCETGLYYYYLTHNSSPISATDKMRWVYSGVWGASYPVCEMDVFQFARCTYSGVRCTLSCVWGGCIPVCEVHTFRFEVGIFQRVKCVLLGVLSGHILAWEVHIIRCMRWAYSCVEGAHDSAVSMKSLDWQRFLHSTFRLIWDWTGIPIENH
jgi:hypothetical protein